MHRHVQKGHNLINFQRFDKLKSTQPPAYRVNVILPLPSHRIAEIFPWLPVVLH